MYPRDTNLFNHAFFHPTHLTHKLIHSTIPKYTSKNSSITWINTLLIKLSLYIHAYITLVFLYSILDKVSDGTPQKEIHNSPTSSPASSKLWGKIHLGHSYIHIFSLHRYTSSNMRNNFLKMSPHKIMQKTVFRPNRPVLSRLSHISTHVRMPLDILHTMVPFLLAKTAPIVLWNFLKAPKDRSQTPIPLL